MRKNWKLAFLFMVLFLSVFGNAAKPKNSIIINETYSYTAGFVKKPQLGTEILKIELFQNGEKSNDLNIYGSYDMPSMRGHHGVAPAKIKTNKNGDYLFPVNFVMRGAWEIVLDFRDEEATDENETIATKSISVRI